MESTKLSIGVPDAILCVEHAKDWIDYMDFQAMDTMIKIVTTDKCTMCIERRNKKCPTCGKKVYD